LVRITGEKKAKAAFSAALLPNRRTDWGSTLSTLYYYRHIDDCQTNCTFLPHPTKTGWVHHNFKFYRAIPLFPKPAGTKRLLARAYTLAQTGHLTGWAA
jgi:hypothetical protein